MNDSNFFKNVGSRFSNSTGLICCTSAILTGVSLILGSVGLVRNSIAIKTLKEENKAMRDEILKNIQLYQFENNDLTNKIIDKLEVVDLIKEQLTSKISEVKKLIDEKERALNALVEGESMKITKSIDSQKADIKKHADDYYKKMQESFNSQKADVKKQIDDYQQYVLSQLQVSQKVDDNRNVMIMENHDAVITELKRIVETGDLEFLKIQNLLLKAKGKLESIQEITGQNNIEIVKNGTLLEKVSVNVEDVAAEVKDRLIWISRYLSTLADNSTSVKDKLSWINRNLHTLTDNSTSVKDKLSWINRNLHTLAENDTARLESLESNFSNLQTTTEKIKSSVTELIENSDQDYQLYQDLITNLSNSNMMLNQEVTTKLRMLEAKLLGQMQQHAKISGNSIKKDLDKIKKEMEKITKMRNDDLGQLSELHESVNTLKQLAKDYQNQDLVIYMELLVDLLSENPS